MKWWPTISTVTDVGTMITYFGVSKALLKEKGSLFSSVERTAITKELTRVEKIIYDITKNSTEIKNIHTGSTEKFVFIGTDMNRIKELVRRLEQEGHVVEIFDDAYLLPKRTFTIDGKQWTVDEAFVDMKDLKKHKTL